MNFCLTTQLANRQTQTHTQVILLGSVTLVINKPLKCHMCKLLDMHYWEKYANVHVIQQVTVIKIVVYRLG